MADEKKTQLSIVIRAIDAATATIKRINDRVQATTKPIRDFKEQLSDLRKNSGLDTVADGFKNVGGAVMDVIGKIAMIGGVVGLAVAGLLHLIGEFDDLGDKAEAMSVSVNFLAQMRYAAQRSGVAVEALDAGLKSFTTSVGLARVGTGKMAALLKDRQPELLKQLKATKSNEEAVDLLANAMAKIEDPAKRAAFASKTFGDASLGVLLGKGVKGIKDLRTEGAKHLGDLSGAAAAAGEADDALVNFQASITGVKAALVSGLAPALAVIVKQLTDWFDAHREDVKKWAAEFGEKLPGAFEKVKKAAGWIVDKLTWLTDSGWKLKAMAVALIGVIVGPLISAIVSLGIALMSTPVGWILAAVAALAIAWYEVITHWDEITAWFEGFWDSTNGYVIAGVALVKVALLPFIGFVTLIIAAWGKIQPFFAAAWDAIKFVFSNAWDFISGIVDKVIGAVDKVKNAAGAVKEFLVGGEGSDVTSRLGWGASGSGSQSILDVAHNAVAAGAIQQSAKVTVEIKNAPPGTRVSADPKSTADVDVLVHQLMPWLQ